MSFCCKPFLLGAIGSLMLLNSANSMASDTEIKLIAGQPGFYDLIGQHPLVQKIADNAQWAEGPACIAPDTLIYSDVIRNEVLSWSEKHGLKTWLAPADHQNGHAVDAEGRVIAASHEQRAVLRREHDGRWVTLIGEWQGKRFHSPNDVVVARDGAVWFTDPKFGLLSKKEGGGKGKPELEGEFVYRYDPAAKKLTKMNTPELYTPNGLAFSPDGKLLYVSDTQRAHDVNNTSLKHRIMVYPVSAQQTGEGRVFAEISPGVPNGIKVDANGNVWTSSGDGVQVFSPAGKRLGKILIPAKATANLALCTDAQNRNWMYVTATNQVLRIPVRVKGADTAAK
ncbi:SMP-30/gluconolactonase/LRE family protein [Erwinia amylovora]|uniref:SMP-30/gluconolactonase/LRE family protein n=1 Tax=Erwinia amylovora TaxID=552 RepID=UPI0002CABBBE|nr:SMP-30/gluconolactonase/LRE family protein [Erwinia amylovora]CDK16864.1 gluconolactonase [Erwinia amylovora LA635]CDK20232.1 gluconolactonase [Erwinia amylovora LA636]CDK23603.1 gluconolactonase [Erwinia amylovora LA637]MBZ2388294.1 SMP-30/gluconolactonase/LRE family protein [Erwinia amylovora]MBZ2394911.1 SMP-30/gluconolactonase/LRE family protein [Erwinia amylovora]